MLGPNSIPESGEQVDKHERISAFALHCIKAMRDNYPEPIELVPPEGKMIDADLVEKIFDVLREQDFVAGPLSRIQLTPRGYRSIEEAAVADFRVCCQLADGDRATSQYDSHDIMLILLRAHFQQWEKDRPSASEIH